jgi:hypothetical protein
MITTAPAAQDPSSSGLTGKAEARQDVCNQSVIGGIGRWGGGQPDPMDEAGLAPVRRRIAIIADSPKPCRA